MSSHWIKYCKTVAAAFVLISQLTACNGFFEKDNTPEPTPLASYKAEVAPRQLWSTKIGAGSESNDYLKMTPSISENAIYTASTNGTVTSINKTNGAKNW